MDDNKKPTTTTFIFVHKNDTMNRIYSIMTRMNANYW